MTHHTRQLADLGMHAAHVKDALLRAVLQETASLDEPFYALAGDRCAQHYYNILRRLRALALAIRDTGSPDLAAAHPSRGISSFEGLRVDEVPNTQLDNQED